jgi:hypothetical protein
MSGYHYALMEISKNQFNKCFTELSDKAKQEVINIYYKYH